MLINFVLLNYKLNQLLTVFGLFMTLHRETTEYGSENEHDMTPVFNRHLTRRRPY